MGPREVCSRWMATRAAILLVILAIPGWPAAAAEETTPAETAGPTGPPASSGAGCDIGSAAWVGSSDAGLACLDGSGWHVIGEGSGLLGDDVRDVAVGPDGRVWVLQLNGLSVTDGATWETYESASQGFGVPVAIAFGPEGSVWLAHFRGVSRFDGSTWTTWPVADLGIEATQYPGSITVAPDGLVWVASSDALASFDGTAWTALTADAGLPVVSYIEDVVAGPEGLWVAHTGGVLGWNGSAWLTNGGDDLDYAQALALDDDGRTWAGTWRRGVSVFESIGWLNYDRERSGLSSDDVRSLAIDDQGRVWAGTAYGLDILEDGAWKAYNMHDSGLLDDTVTAVAVSGPGPSLPAPVERAPGSLSGIVLEGAAPLTGASAVLCTETTTWASEGSLPCADLPFSMQATTGPDGRFSFEGVPVGRYDVIIQASSGDWVSAVRTLGPLSDRFTVQEGAPTDVGSVDIAADESAS